MGLISATMAAAHGTLADQWQEFFYCESIPNDILVVKGQQHRDSRSQNRGNDNIISNGSKIAVADGQFMIIVEQGEIVEFCGQPGEFVWDASTEPSLLTGALDEAAERIIEVGKTMLKRFVGGGATMKDQRIYYFNTKEIYGNKYGTQSPIPFRLVDPNVGLYLTLSVRCNGEYSYKLVNPLALYKHVVGNDADIFRKSEIESQMRAELLSAMQPAFAKIAAKGVRYDELPLHTAELCDALNEELSAKWRDLRGIEIVSFAINSITIPEEDLEKIQKLEMSVAYGSNAAAAAGRMTDATANAMEDAANNTNGAVGAFMGMGMAQNAGGVNTNALFQQAQQQQAAPAADGWTCACGQVNTGKFCANCGAAKPAPAGSWTCECGAVNTGKFCPECGKSAPAAVVCAKCGYKPEGAAPKFCPECGSAF